MIQDITKRWLSSGPWMISLHISGSLLGVLSRVNHPDWSEEKWIFGQDGKSRELIPKEAARIVANEASLPRDIGEGEVVDSRFARQDDAAYAEELFDRPESTQQIIYQDGDFMVRIARLPGMCRFGKFSVLLEIAVSDFDGYYVVHREEMRNWKHWPKALGFLLSRANEITDTHAKRINGTLVNLEDEELDTEPLAIVIVDRPEDHVEVAR